MRHLVKKYVRAYHIGEDVTDILKNTPVNENDIRGLVESKFEGYYGFAFTEDKQMIQTFKYDKDDKTYLIPEPDPIVIYFDTARGYHKVAKERKERLFSDLTTLKYNISAVNGSFYWYFSAVSNYVLFLFLSAEAFVNKTIPNEYEYKKVIGDKKTEIYDKYQIQRNIDFLEKVKVVLPDSTGKNFVAEWGHKYDAMRNLKNFRDEIAHTKSFEGENVPNLYQNLFVMSLEFDLNKILYYVRDFINFYQPNLIEECNCNAPD